MTYTSTRTWLPGDTFPVGDHNTYLRDNFKQIRTFQQLGQPFSAGPITLSAAATAVITALNIQTIPIDEPWQLQVIAYCSAFGTTTPGGINVTMLDNTGVALVVQPGTLWMPTGGASPGSGIAVGTSVVYGANLSKPGFTIRFQLTFGTVGTGYCTAVAYARPTTTTVRP